MRPSAFDRFTAEHMGILRLADEIADVLGNPATSRDLEAVAFRIIDANEQVIRPHLRLENDIVLRVLAEYLGGSHHDLVSRAMREVGAIQNRILALREAVEMASPLREILEDTEFALRDYVDYEESTLLPFAKRHVAEKIDALEQELSVID